MTELVYWSCILGFSPLILSIGWTLFDIVAGPRSRIAGRPPVGHRFDQDERFGLRFGPHRIARAGGAGHGR